jgi:hypothetical protein
VLRTCRVRSSDMIQLAYFKQGKRLTSFNVQPGGALSKIGLE